MCWGLWTVLNLRPWISRSGVSLWVHTNGLMSGSELNPECYPSTDYCNHYTTGFIAYFLIFFLLCHDSFSCLSLLASPPTKKPTLSRIVSLWGLVEEMLGSISEGEILPSPPTKGEELLESSLSHDEVKNCQQNFFLYCTKSLCYNREHYYFCFLVWQWHKVSQTIPLGGCVQPQELPSHIYCREELLLMAEQKVSKLQNSFYYNMA